MIKKNEVIINEEEKLILREAIDKAEKNGYKGHLRYLPVFIKPTKNKKINRDAYDKSVNDLFYFHGREIVFDIAFQKAFFPKGDIDKERNIIKDWKYYTREMLKTNPIRFIESYL